jgi:BirA family biotin operon repressor/biotin-[acetyl-CoA-carboxylase] ligase
MLAGFERLSLDQIESRLRTDRIGRTAGANELWDSIDSTNARVAELAAKGAPEGVFVTARQQTAGRGRLGRTWVSPPDAGVYLSVLLRPESPVVGAQLAPITLAMGVAAARAVETSVGVKLGLKWVNDLVHGRRKVGGILAEMPSGGTAGSSKESSLVVGIGLNVRFAANDVPEELRDKIDWLEQIAAMPVNPNEIAVCLLLEIEKVYEDLKQGRADAIVSEWRSRSVTLGKEIIATSGNATVEGVAVDVDGNGALAVKTADGTIKYLHAGEITIRGTDGKYA